MSTSMKTTSLLQGAQSVASVGNENSRSYASRSISRLVQSTAVVACFVAATLSAAPVAAQSYHPSSQYGVSTNDKLYGTVVGVSTYRERTDNRASDLERRQRNAQQQAQRRTSNLIGSIVNAAVGDALGGSNRYSRSLANIGGSYAGQMTRGMVDSVGSQSRSRVNSEGWSGNVRVMPQDMSLVTIDVRYPGNVVERVQVRQPKAVSEGLRRGDEVALQFTVDPRTNQPSFVAVEVPKPGVRSGYRR